LEGAIDMSQDRSFVVGDDDDDDNDDDDEDDDDEYSVFKVLPHKKQNSSPLQRPIR